MTREQDARHQMSVRRIGELAAAAGVSVDTLRYYERERLLPPPVRTAGGFRLYAPETVERLRFIRQAQQIGLSLREIRQLLDPDNCLCSAVRDVIAERLAEVDERLRELASFRDTLQTALQRCEQTLVQSKKAPCPVVRQLGTPELAPARPAADAPSENRI
jgi:MerR family mercuric resistance operon transcriptional regulator